MMKATQLLLLSAMCLASAAQAAPVHAKGAPIDFQRLPERDVAVICGYTLSEGAVLLYRSNRLSADERVDAVRHFVAAAEYWHFRAGQLHSTEKLLNEWADKLDATGGISKAQYKYCGATAARRTEALPEADQETIRTSTAKVLLSIVSKYTTQ